MLEDKHEAKFGGVMSAQNIHHILTFYHVFGSFHIVISVVIALYLITRLLMHFREKVAFGGCRET